MSNYYIYKLYDPRNRAVRYIGCTQNIQKRYRKHCFDTVNKEKMEWIQVLKHLNLLPRIKVIGVYTSKKEAKRMEKIIIKEYAKYGTLTNIHYLKPMDEEHRRKISLAMKGKKRNRHG